MTRKAFIKKHPELFLATIKEGVELALNGCTEFYSPHDVERANEEIEQKWKLWEEEAKEEQEYLKMV